MATYFFTFFKIIFLLTLTGILVFFLLGIRKGILFKKNAKTIEGKVVDIVEKIRYAKRRGRTKVITDYYPVIKYTSPSGESLTVTCYRTINYSGENVFTVGQSILVYYNPNDPKEEIAIYDNDYTRAIAIIIILIIIEIALVYLFFIRKTS